MRPPTGFRAVVDPIMRQLAVSATPDLVFEAADELRIRCTEAPWFEEDGAAGGLYVIFAELDDVLDGYPFHYGDDAVEIAAREMRRAALEWLATPHTEAAAASFVERWHDRLAEPFTA